MASIGFRIRSKANKPVSIYTYVNLGGGRQTLEVKTGFTIHPNNWSQKKQQAKLNNGFLKNLNHSLQELKIDINNKINESLTKPTIYNNEWLKKTVHSHFNRIDKRDDSIIVNSIITYINSAETKKGINGKLGLSTNTVKRWEYFLKVFEEFQKYAQETLTFSHIDRDFSESFSNWLLKEKNYSKNNAGKFLSQLKTICKDAQSRGVKVPSFYIQIKSFRQPNNERYINTITSEEIEQIKGLKLKSESLENVRKWLLVGLSIGQRISDLLSIDKDKIRVHQNGYLIIDIYQKKTDKYVAPAIIDKKIINLVYPNFPYKISEQKFNEYMKIVCEKSGINSISKGYKLNKEINRKELVELPKYNLLSSHDLRRSFATNYFGKVPTPILMELTGHSKETSFLTYIGKNQDKDYYADAFINAITK